MSVFASLILSLSLIMGVPVSLSEHASTPVSVTCEEDMPCWDSATMGQVLPALSDNELDAWDAVAVAGITSTPDVALQYVETLDYRPASFPLGYFAVASQTQPQAFHVMQWVTLYHA